MTTSLATESEWTAARMPNLAGQTIIVTGANSGIGLEASRAFAARGANIVLAVRDESKGRAAAATITGSTEVRQLDLADLASVREFAARWSGDIHILVNNAGVLVPPFGAAPTLFASTEPVPGGSYAGPGNRREMAGPPTLVTRAAAASDPDTAARLWAASEELTGISYPFTNRKAVK